MLLCCFTRPGSSSASGSSSGSHSHSPHLHGCSSRSTAAATAAAAVTWQAAAARTRMRSHLRGGLPSKARSTHFSKRGRRASSPGQPPRASRRRQPSPNPQVCEERQGADSSVVVCWNVWRCGAISLAAREPCSVPLMRRTPDCPRPAAAKRGSAKKRQAAAAAESGALQPGLLRHLCAALSGSSSPALGDPQLVCCCLDLPAHLPPHLPARLPNYA